MRHANSPVHVLVALVLGLFASPAFAQRKDIRRKPSSDSVPQLIQINVHYGDKLTELRVETKNGISYYTMVSSQEVRLGREMASDDVAYLVSKLREAPAKLEASGRCPRQWVYAAIISEGKTQFQASACLDDRTKTAKVLMGVANLLSTTY